ncbi:response regulator transcription factor [Sphingobium lactosutens]|jgi:DNA-binding NarL/FixJ family response regulator|uniref:HTH luxR-type domain-containing protein n=1 Tax=Sphingobium lactosutens DS20 TaxID=1331060 RepID=T0IT37_9SPHN|nr:LuxR C-terminal-related transcriptional regulator [Sphingobium lactosutens]EQB12814.1 hypothetical protein RLDS_18745 [Sphingobium lactosutens DS20]
MHVASNPHGYRVHDNGPPAPAAVTPPRLTPTQMKVMRCVHSGLLNKQIAYELGMAEATVKVHMTALMRKLNVRNRTQVAIIANSLAWLPDASDRSPSKMAD